MMGTVSLPRLLTPAAFAVVFRVLLRDALRASRSNTRSCLCERRSRERSSSKKVDALGIRHARRLALATAVFQARKFLLYYPHSPICPSADDTIQIMPYSIRNCVRNI